MAVEKDFFESLDESEAVPAAREKLAEAHPAAPPVGAASASAVSVPPTEHDKIDGQLRAMSDQIFEKHLRVLDDMAAWRDVDPTKDEPPWEWTRALGAKEAAKRYRVARSAWASAKDAPAGLKLSAQIAIGMMKAKATEKGGSTTLNIIAVSLPTPTTRSAQVITMPEQEVTDV